MFRSSTTVLQSLHRFRVQQRIYDLPILLRLSSDNGGLNLVNGDVL